MIGSQAVLDARNVEQTAAAVERLGVPVYLSGMARGLMGKNHPLHLRHKRRLALKVNEPPISAGIYSKMKHYAGHFYEMIVFP